MSYVCDIPYSTTGFLECGWCQQGSEVYILVNFNSVEVRYYRILAAAILDSAGLQCVLSKEKGWGGGRES